MSVPCPRMTAVRVISANVNGIRAALRRGGMTWLAAQHADVLCLQEVRGSPAHLSEALHAVGLGGWRVAHAVSDLPGRAGVAVVTRGDVDAVSDDLGPPEFHGAGRWIEARIRAGSAPVTIASTYVHTGAAGTARQDEKHRFLDALTARVEAALARGERFLLTGDLNVAHAQADLKNWKGNLGKAGFLDSERAYFDRWVRTGLVDVHRALAGPGPGPYTWWSWRGKAFDNDAGWRIDHHWATPGLAATARAAWVGRAPTYAERWSDHAPVVVDYELSGSSSPTSSGR